MKTKLIVSTFIIVFAVSFYSFKLLGEKEASDVVLVMAIKMKEEKQEGYLIQYSDGTTELIPFEIVTSIKNSIATLGITSKIMNDLHKKGYRYIGSQHTPNHWNDFMVFEKN